MYISTKHLPFSVGRCSLTLILAYWCTLDSSSDKKKCYVITTCSLPYNLLPSWEGVPCVMVFIGVPRHSPCDVPRAVFVDTLSSLNSLKRSVCLSYASLLLIQFRQVFLTAVLTKIFDTSGVWCAITFWLCSFSHTNSLHIHVFILQQQRLFSQRLS